jgi:hypothetical protein
MSGDNALSHFSSAELVKIVGHRNQQAALFQNLGPYPCRCHPAPTWTPPPSYRNTPVTIDVLRNDSDMNGEALSLVTSNLTTTLGGSVTRLAGAGPGGRDLLQYTPPPTMGSGTDWFRYRIRDASGMEVGELRGAPPALQRVEPADHWRLDDPTGTVAVNRVRSQPQWHFAKWCADRAAREPRRTRTGMFSTAWTTGSRSPRPITPRHNSPSPPGSNAMETRTRGHPCVMSRTSATAYGIGFGTNNELRYHWATIWDLHLAAIPAAHSAGQRMVPRRPEYRPERRGMFLRDSTGLQSARNDVRTSRSYLIGAMVLGHDTNGSRHFKGWMDDVRIYQNTLAAADIESLYQQAVNPPEWS